MDETTKPSTRGGLPRATGKRAAKAESGSKAAAGPGAGAPVLVSLAQQVRGWADNVINLAGSAADTGLALAQARLRDPKQKAAVAKAGRQLRRWREAAGLTLEELSQAVGLGDARLIEQAEGGVVSLPFDVVLRLAGILGRRDPLPVAMALTRQYNPELWKSLEALGVGKLVVQGTRERELANIYRGCDAARSLDDEQFAVVLAFTRQAFAMAITFSGAHTTKARTAVRPKKTAD